MTAIPQQPTTEAHGRLRLPKPQYANLFREPDLPALTDEDDNTDVESDEFKTRF